MKLRKSFGLVFFCLFSAAFAAEKPNVKTSSVATLNSLTFDPSITKNTVSGPDFRDYVATVSNSVSSVKVFPVATDPAATVKVNGVAVPTGSSSASVFLGVGNNTVLTTVTSSDGTVTNAYVITITRLASTVATLNSLTYNPGITATLVSGPDYKDYTATVSSPVSSIKVTPLATEPAAVVKVNGTKVLYGAASVAIPLNVGANTITTVITAPDGVTTKTYSITITRNAPPILSSLSFDPSITKTTVTGTNFRDYTATVPGTVSSIKVIPVSSAPSLTIKVNGVTVASGSASAVIPLSTGDNTITTVVTEADGITKNTYSTVVTRQLSAIATLTSLSFNPKITKTVVTGPDFKDYTATVTNAVSSIQVIPVTADPTATITVNGKAVVSGAASPSISLIADGNTTIKTVVTAANGVSKNTYSIVITRQPSNEAILNSLSFSPNVGLDEVSGPGYKNYQTGVDSSVSAIRVKAVPTVKEATMKVNGTALASGVFSAPIPLAYGKNTLTVTVTSAFGTVTHSYITTITRKYVATLSALHADNPYLPGTAISGADFRDYVADVPHQFTSVKIIPTLTDPLSSVTVNGVAVTSGTASPAIPLSVGKNTILIVVTARNRQIGNTYKIVATRLGSSANPPAYAEDNPATVAKPEIFVHTNLSPNGDGVADKLLIDGIATYPDNMLMIISRAGTLVYQANGYDNTLKVFDGHSSVNGKLQQAGTYFYSFDYKTDGLLKHKTGYIIIKY